MNAAIRCPISAAWRARGASPKSPPAPGADDLVLCLISGGASALLPLPADPITLDEKQETTKLLLACGANIHEINAVRKHISRIKGGQLARLAYPARVLSLLLSDVIGDDLDVIGSGPTAPDASTFARARAILEKYGIFERAPAPIRERLERGARGEIAETPKPGDRIFARRAQRGDRQQSPGGGCGRRARPRNWAFARWCCPRSWKAKRARSPACTPPSPKRSCMPGGR